MNATAETKKNAIQEFLAYQTRMAAAVQAEIVLLAKRLAGDVDEMNALNYVLENDPNCCPNDATIKNAAHLAHAAATYAAKLAELAAMQKAMQDLRNAESFCE